MLLNYFGSLAVLTVDLSEQNVLLYGIFQNLSSVFMSPNCPSENLLNTQTHIEEC